MLFYDLVVKDGMYFITRQGDTYLLIGNDLLEAGKSGFFKVNSLGNYACDGKNLHGYDNLDIMSVMYDSEVLWEREEPTCSGYNLITNADIDVRLKKEITEPTKVIIKVGDTTHMETVLCPRPCGEIFLGDKWYE